MMPVCVVFTCTWRVVTSFAVEWRVKYTISFAFMSKRALIVVTTFKRHAAFVSLRWQDIIVGIIVDVCP